MISCSLVGERLIVDPEDWNSVEMEAIGGVGSVLATTAVDLLRITSLNGVVRTFAIVEELFVGLLATIARARRIT